MWFRNISLFRIPNFHFTAEQIEAALAARPFQPCAALESHSMGWTPARQGSYAYTVNGEHLIALRLSRKVLPAAVVRQEVAARCEAHEHEHGYRPGRKLTKEIKERAYDDLLPKAFEIARDVRAWISPKHEILVIDTSAQKMADAYVGLLVRALSSHFSIHLPVFKVSPSTAMTAWAAEGEAPGVFTIDDGNTAFSGGTGAQVKYSKFSLENIDASKHIAAGRIVTNMTLTWDDRVSFTLTGAGAIRRATPLDVLQAGKKSMDDDEFDSDFMLMTATYAGLIAELAEAFSGFEPVEDLFDQAANTKISDPGVDDADEAPAVLLKHDPADGPDPMYPQAREIVLQHRRASISLVQRYLRIGYNRAARLLEQMEVDGVVSAMNADGNREILMRASGDEHAA